MIATQISSGFPSKPTLVLWVVGIGTLLGAMSASMINLALPSMGRDFQISIDTSRWVVQSYLLVLAVLMLPSGRISDLLGHNRTYLTGLALFGGTSVLCGASPNYELLILARVFQAMGGAMVMASGPALLTTSFPDEKRGRVLGMLATATYTGLMIGPPLGGFIIEWLGWRWTFYLSAPLCFALCALGLNSLPKVRRTSGAKFDWGGTASLIIGLPFALLAVSEGHRWGVQNIMTWTSLMVGVTGTAVFLWIQSRRTHPLLDLALFRSKVFVGTIISAFANYVALFVMIILMPFFLEEGLGKEPAAAGLILSVQPFVMALVASPAGWLSDRIGSRGLAFAGMVVLSLGLLGLSLLNCDSPISYLVGCLAVVGLGTGTFISPNSSALMGSAPKNQQGAAGSILAESRILGMLMGVALATFLFKAFGGQTGKTWTSVDLDAFRVSTAVGAAVAMAGAVAAALRGKARV